MEADPSSAKLEGSEEVVVVEVLDVVVVLVEVVLVVEVDIVEEVVVEVVVGVVLVLVGVVEVVVVVVVVFVVCGPQLDPEYTASMVVGLVMLIGAGSVVLPLSPPPSQ